MAKQAKTSITENAALTHVKSGAFRSELSCSKIVGFHLQKMKTASTWRFRYRDIDNKAKIVNLGKYVDGKKDRLAAAELALTYRGQVEEGRDPVAEASKELSSRRAAHVHEKTSTLGAYLEGAYKIHQSRKRNGGTHTLNIIRSNFKEYLDLPMAELSVGLLEAWQAKRENEKRSYATISRACGALKTMIRHAISKEVLKVDPLTNFKLAAPVSEEVDKKSDGSELKKRRMLTSLELEQLNKGVEAFFVECKQKEKEGNSLTPAPTWFYYFFRLAAYSGLRPGDLYTLNWYELNLNFKQIIKTPMKTRHHFKNPITVNIGLNDEMHNLMKEWHTRQGKPTGGDVFINPTNGKQYDRQAHSKHWERVLELGGVKDHIDFYSLRHHFISKMIASGVNIFTVAKLAGHKDLKMIESHYGHLAPDASSKAIAMVASDFSSLSDSTQAKARA